MKYKYIYLHNFKVNGIDLLNVYVSRILYIYVIVLYILLIIMKMVRIFHTQTYRSYINICKMYIL